MTRTPDAARRRWSAVNVRVLWPLRDHPLVRARIRSWIEEASDAR